MIGNRWTGIISARMTKYLDIFKERKRCGLARKFINDLKIKNFYFDIIVIQ